MSVLAGSKAASYPGALALYAALLPVPLLEVCEHQKQEACENSLFCSARHPANRLLILQGRCVSFQDQNACLILLGANVILGERGWLRCACM